MLLEVDVQSGCAALTLPASLQRTLGSEIETTLVDKVLEVLQRTVAEIGLFKHQDSRVLYSRCSRAVKRVREPRRQTLSNIAGLAILF